ncbi:P-loop containing nucleoside triphosphate hydrolase protein [Mycena filopes]|nr:P-loop containing nucleoside triphosphate hydrolase protein [Mycena filopes]
MTQLSQSGYATQRKDMLALISRLRSVGAQAELDLPRIAVIGNQSAGKSSVVEAISGIKVPRESGTCTRSPFECRMSSAPRWACRISIRREFDHNGKRLGKVFEVPFCAPIQDKDAVELMLRRAQLAALDPTIASTEILDMDLERLKDLSGKAMFSKNVVCIDLEGPELTDLQFVDLPGIIQNAKPDMVRLVEEMVVENIRGNCLILVAIPMTDDIENQKAMSLAREQDPKGNRTIGVLTKPDLISAGSTKSRALWLDVIEGRRHPLLHGYYCTRQPDEEERAKGMTASEARRAEIDFFATAPGWSTSTEQNRFGTDTLISTLSSLLVQIIVEKLPTIRQIAHMHLEQCRAALATLPEPSTEDPATHMLTLITEFCSEIKQIVRGSADPSGLIQSNNAAFGQFKRAIRRTAPRFVAIVEGEGELGGSVDVVSDEDELNTDGGARKKPVYLDDVREVLRKARARELPGDIPPAAKELLIADFQETWAGSAQTCFDSVRESMLDVLVKVMQRIFRRYGTLRGALHEYLPTLIAVHAAECSANLETALEVERTPMTQNDHYLRATTEKWVERYKAQRAGENLPASVADVPPSAKRRKVAEKQSKSTAASFGPFPAFAFAPTTTPASPAPTSSFGGPSAFGGGEKPTTPSSAFGGGPLSPALTRCPSQSLPNQPRRRSPNFVRKSRLRREPVPLQPRPRRRSATSFPNRPRLHPQAASPFGPFTSSTPTEAGAAPSTAGPFSGINASTSAANSVGAALAMLAQAGYAGLTEEALGRLRNGADEYETEIMLMSGVRAYFQVSFKRVIDHIPGLIDTKFVKALAKGLQANLIREFKLGQPEGHARCAEYLTEDAALVAKRGELAQRVKMLEGVRRDLLKYGV